MRIEQSVTVTENGVSTSTKIVNNKDKWTPTQRGMLLLLVENHKSWEQIGEELKRTPSSCRSMYTYVSLKDKINTLEDQVAMDSQRIEMKDMLIQSQGDLIKSMEENIRLSEETIEILEDTVKLYKEN